MPEIEILSEGLDVEEQLDQNRSPDFSGEAFNIKWTGNKALDLKWMAQQRDLCQYMDEGARTFYGQRLSALVAVDEGSRAEWRVGAEKGLEITNEMSSRDVYDGDVSDEEGEEYQAAPRFPLVTQAIIEFAAQAGEALLSDQKIVKVSAPNFTSAENDAKQAEEAETLSDSMSWQVMVVDRNWLSDTDKLLHMVAGLGTLFRKRWVDPVTGHNRSRVCSGLDVVVNNRVSNLGEAPRITEKYTDFPHVVRSKVQSGEFYDVDMKASMNSDDWHTPIEFWEIHTWLDLDDDGADEPYIVTIQSDVKRVVALRAGFTEDGFTVTDKGVQFVRLQQFTAYHLIPSFDGSFYSKGFGHLVGRLSDTIDDLVASIIDTAKLNNSNGGVIGRIGTGLQGSIPIARDELTVIPTDGQTLQSQVVMFPTKEVPATLFSVLTMLTDAGKQLTSTVNLMDQAVGNMPATTAMAVVDQGARIYSAILQRQWRAMGEEFTLMYDMNKATMEGDVRFSFEGREGKVTPEQFKPTRDVSVSADPRIASSSHRALLSGYYAQFIGDPSTNQEELRKRMHSLMRVPQPQALITPAPPGIPPDVQAEIDEANSKIFEREVKAKLVAAQAVNEMLNALATISNLAPQLAGTPEVGAQFASAYAIMQQIANIGANTDVNGMDKPAGGGQPGPNPNQLSGMANGPGNGGAAQLPPPPSGGVQAPMGFG